MRICAGIPLVMWLICRNTFVPQSAIATTNRKCREWAGVFNNSDMMASAVLDRLLENGEIVVIDGECYRIRNELM